MREKNEDESEAEGGAKSRRRRGGVAQNEGRGGRVFEQLRLRLHTPLGFQCSVERARCASISFMKLKRRGVTRP